MHNDYTIRVDHAINDNCSEVEQETLINAFIIALKAMPLFFREAWIDLNSFEDEKFKATADFSFTMSRLDDDSLCWNAMCSTEDKCLQIFGRRTPPIVG